MKIKIDRLSIQNYFLYLYFFSINVENFNPTGYFSISKLAGITYIASAFLSFKNFTSLNRKQLYFYWPILIFIIYLTLISIINFNDYSNRFFDIAFIQNILIFMVLVNHVRKDSYVLEKGMFALSVGSIVVSFFLFLGIGVSEIATEGDIVRKTFFNAGANELALKLSAGLAIIISILYENTLKIKKWIRLLLIFSVPLLILGILGTASRTAFLILPACGLAWFGFKLLASNNKFYALLLGLFTLVIFLTPIIFIALQAEQFQFLAERLANTGGIADISETGRFTLWLGYFSLIFENFIFGNGYSGFDLLSYEFFGFIESPHNVLLEVFLYTGLIGFLIYILFLSRIFVVSYKLYKQKSRILPTIIIPIALAFILILQGLNEKICWIILAYIIGTYMYSFKKFKHLNEDFNSH
tara:strand:+ start:17710 stop:18948 length:1239 start_codon:yes stop_codon:yes gene_type:complete